MPPCDFIRSPSCFKRCSLWRLKVTSLADSVPRGHPSQKRRRGYNEIELAMARIGLFIIPPAEEKQGGEDGGGGG